MSQATASKTRDKFFEAAVPLLTEYGQKLDSLREKLARLREKYDAEGNEKDKPYILRMEYDLTRDLFDKLQPTAKMLAQHVSQWIEHAAMDDLTKLELRLRLAEFEHALAATDKSFGQYRF